MTPAINLVKKHKIKYVIHEYEHEASCDSYGLEAAEKMGVIKDRIFKTLVLKLDEGSLAVAVLPVSSKLSMKLIAKNLKSKKAIMAGPIEVNRSTGYVLGGVSPLGQKKRLETIIDISAKNHHTIFVSAGRRGLEIELKSIDLANLTNANFAKICQLLAG